MGPLSRKYVNPGQLGGCKSRVESMAREEGTELDQLSTGRMNELWDEVKSQE